MRRILIGYFTLHSSSLVWADHGIEKYYLTGKAYQGGKLLSNDSLQVRYFGMDAFSFVPDSAVVLVDASGQFSVPFYFPAHCSIINRPRLHQSNPALFAFLIDLYESFYPDVYLEICFMGDCKKFENEALRYYPPRMKELDIFW